MFVLAAADMVIKRVQVVSETSDLIVLGDVHLFDQIGPFFDIVFQAALQAIRRAATHFHTER